jgi:hypothetical protein
MASRFWHCTPVLGAFALMLGCLQVEGSEGTFGNTDLGTGGPTTLEGNEGFEADLDAGQEGGLFGECGGYIDACLQDPYCFCFLDCVVANAEAGSDNPLAGCLERCQLAQIPYWADQFIVCAQGDLGLPEPDTGNEGQDGEEGGVPSTGG